MTAEEVNLAFSVLGLREQLIVELAILAGMRPEKSSRFGMVG